MVGVSGEGTGDARGERKQRGRGGRERVKEDREGEEEGRG